MSAIDNDASCAAASRAGAKIRKLYDDAHDEVHDVVGRVDHHIHEKPVESTLIALGTGLLLGLLLGGRR